MKLDKLLIIQMLKDCQAIKDENDIAELKIDDGNIFVKLKQPMEYVEITMEVNE